MEIMVIKTKTTEKISLFKKKSLLGENCAIEECRKGKNNCTTEVVSMKLRQDFDSCTFSGFMEKDKNSRVSLQMCNDAFQFNIVSNKVRSFI